MTLGSFFRDYVYIPLGGNRKRVYLNLLIVWFLTGFWHGASWNFVIWGLYIGAFIMLERLIKPIFEKLPAFIRHLYLIIVVDIGFVFFYHTDLNKALEYIGAMFGGNKCEFTSEVVNVNLANNMFFIILAVILCMPLSQVLKRISNAVAAKSSLAMTVTEIVKNVCLMTMLILCTAFLAGGSYSPFMYFQF